MTSSRLKHQPMKEPRECCGIVFTESIRLAQHQHKVHTTRDPIACECGCGRTYLGSTAHRRHLRSGDPAHREARFWPKVNKNGSIPDYAPHLGPCWEWLARCDTKGYGLFYLGPNWRIAGAHRYSYELAHGPVSKDLELDHLCRNIKCVNPAHLEPVTHLENTRRGVEAWKAKGCPCDRCDFVAETNGGLAAHRRFKHDGYVRTRSSETADD